jgi:hypothetical protein
MVKKQQSCQTVSLSTSPQNLTHLSLDVSNQVQDEQKVKRNNSSNLILRTKLATNKSELTLTGASRFKSLNLGLSLAASPIDLIKKQSELIHQKYMDS